jgi:hypothetical protein
MSLAFVTYVRMEFQNPAGASDRRKGGRCLAQVFDRKIEHSSARNRPRARERSRDKVIRVNRLSDKEAISPPPSLASRFGLLLGFRFSSCSAVAVK